MTSKTETLDYEIRPLKATTPPELPTEDAEGRTLPRPGEVFHLVEGQALIPGVGVLRRADSFTVTEKMIRESFDRLGASWTAVLVYAELQDGARFERGPAPEGMRPWREVGDECWANLKSLALEDAHRRWPAGSTELLRELEQIEAHFGGGDPRPRNNLSIQGGSY